MPAQQQWTASLDNLQKWLCKQGTEPRMHHTLLTHAGPRAAAKTQFHTNRGGTEQNRMKITSSMDGYCNIGGTNKNKSKARSVWGNQVGGGCQLWSKNYGILHGICRPIKTKNSTWVDRTSNKSFTLQSTLRKKQLTRAEHNSSLEMHSICYITPRQQYSSTPLSPSNYG